ncbi:type I-F CRISPR-associated protein Csy2 [Pseudorhodoferax sp. LjRoot39]|uniref:type I-F CRISPR-associated protein Csy2 n=1 Tax=Pseudorhodoferax sp. LjRoot39 TaxID=3342328 RepID=UPI003ECFD35D
MATESPPIDALLVLPRLRIQNANAISSPLTWGFPSMTAFLGLMQALERRLPQDFGWGLVSAGVVCHDFQAQATRGGFTHAFHLTRNPVGSDGGTAAIVEEGRIHLEVTLVFGVQFLDGFAPGDGEREQCMANAVGELVAGMRVAGGSVMPSLRRLPAAQSKPRLQRFDYGAEERAKLFRAERRRWLPGFALVSRDDLLAEHLAALRQTMPAASALDAWLDLSRLNYRAERRTGIDPATGQGTEQVEWTARRPPGWIVPIPVGYGALSELHPAGTVAGARDRETPLRFVESLYSVGQWISPHRLKAPTDLLWHAHHDPASGLYRCVNPLGGARTAAADLAPLV